MLKKSIASSISGLLILLSACAGTNGSVKDNNPNWDIYGKQPQWVEGAEDSGDYVIGTGCAKVVDNNLYGMGGANSVAESRARVHILLTRTKPDDKGILKGEVMGTSKVGSQLRGDTYCTRLRAEDYGIDPLRRMMERLYNESKE